MRFVSLTEQILTSSIARRLRPLVRGKLAHTASEFSERVREENAYQAAMNGKVASSEAILERLKVSYQPVTSPLVLISQAQRSGGSLLSQLFDGHTEILAHPHELKIGHPKKEHWPLISPSLSIDEQFRILFEPSTVEMCQDGYAKDKQNPQRRNFYFMPQMQRELFRHLSTEVKFTTPRDVLNVYFTSYFHCWLNLGTDISRVKLITGFVPMLIGPEDNMTQFWRAYPDGYLISIIRSPLSWYPSAARLAGGQKLKDLEKAIGRWRDSTEAIFREKQRRTERVIVLHFDDLVTNTEAVMRYVCGRIGIAFEPALLTPSFNGKPLSANTSFERMEQGAVSDAPIHRHKHLTDADRRQLEIHCIPLYERALLEIVEKVPRILKKQGEDGAGHVSGAVL